MAWTRMRNDRLKELRERSGHTQESLAELLGKDIKQVWRWESGKADPSADALVDLAQALKVSTDYLLGISDNPTPNNQSGELSVQEWQVIRALRRGERYEAIKAIVSG
jgi:transcriptional regulator with XRE-family HTH domain